MSNINNPETENVKEPVEKISTKLKFVKSDKTDAYVGFVSQNPRQNVIVVFARIRLTQRRCAFWTRS